MRNSSVPPNPPVGTNTRDLNCLLARRRFQTSETVSADKIKWTHRGACGEERKEVRSCRKFNQFPQSSSCRRTSPSENTLTREPTPAQLGRGSARWKTTRRRRTHARTHDRNFIRDPKFFFDFVNTTCAVKRDKIQRRKYNLIPLGNKYIYKSAANMNQGYLAPVSGAPLHLLHIHTRREFHALLHSLFSITIACATRWACMLGWNFKIA